MHRASFVLLLSAVALAGCDHFLAKVNPCGGTYPADNGDAEVFTTVFSGKVTVQTASGTKAYAFTANPQDNVDCDTFVSGLASEDGTATINVEVECPLATVSFTFPDVRPLAQGTQISVPATVTFDDGSKNDSTASVSIDEAIGTKQPSPTFVSADFLRSATITFDSCNADADAGDDAGNSESCGAASNATVSGNVRFVASDYSPAETSGDDHCPDLPSK